MTKPWLRWEWWVASLALLIVTIALGGIGVVYVIDPVPAAAAFGMSLTTPDAISSARVGFGAFHMGLALVTCGGLLVPAWRRSALICAFTFGATIIVVRAGSLMVDGGYGPARWVFAREAASFAALTFGLFTDLRLARTEIDAGIPPRRD